MKDFRKLVALFFISIGILSAGVEKEKFFNQSQKDRNNFVQFSLTSKDTEIFHQISELNLLAKLRKAAVVKEGAGASFDEFEWKAEKTEQIHEIWNKFFQDLPSGGELYIVHYVSDEAGFSGYYYIVDGNVIKENVYDL